jgi:hypothetical protein
LKLLLIIEVSSIDWNAIPLQNDVNEIFNTFSDVIDTHVPLKKLSGKEVKFNSFKPWITSAIRVSIKQKKIM